jgi:hypothetical protein
MVIWVLLISSLIIWCCVPFRQYRTGYFYFFIILAVADPFKLTLLYTFKIIPMNVSPIIFIFLIFSLYSKKYTYIPILASIIYFIILLQINFEQYIPRNISFIFQIGISIIILYRILHYLYENKAINLFLVILMTYLLINTFKYLAVILNFEQGSISYLLGSISQILFGILFLFINEKTKDFNLTSTMPENITLP